MCSSSLPIKLHKSSSDTFTCGLIRNDNVDILNSSNQSSINFECFRTNYFHSINVPKKVATHFSTFLLGCLLVALSKNGLNNSTYLSEAFTLEKQSYYQIDSWENGKMHKEKKLNADYILLYSYIVHN